MKNNGTFTFDKINMLVHLYQKYNNINALNKLWEFYCPLIMDIVLYKIAKEHPEMEDYALDIIDETYFSFIKGLEGYSPSTYCFGSYIEKYIDKSVSDNIDNYNGERIFQGTV